MSANKKKKGIFLIVSSIIVVLAVTVNILATGLFYDLACMFLGRAKPVYAEGVTSMYIPETTSKKEAYENASETNIELCEEGFVLLKNKDDALPLKKNLNVSVFGKNSVNIAYAGGGSGSFVVDPTSSLYKRMLAAGIDLSYRTIFDALEGYYNYNQQLKSFYEDDKLSGDRRSNTNVDLDSGDDKIFTVGETPLDKYTSNIIKSYENYKDVAVVVITRIGGEGADLPRHQGNTAGAVSSDAHYLELDKNEIDMLTHICTSGFKKVVVLLNIPSAMEANFLVDTSVFPYADKIDAALWIGFTGKQGIMALSPILSGEISPSGKTVDTWSADFLADPTSVNFGTGIEQARVSKTQCFDQYNEGLYYFVNYEEGIYEGYRYYETRGCTDGEAWYSKNVVYPFGYGLSYTTFDWEVKSQKATSFGKTNKITIEVKVTNTGDYSGKDVVQVYVSTPYTDGQIEKSHKVLVGFAKTETLRPNQSETVSIDITPYDFASYDYRDANGNGFYGYELDAGEYTFYISHNAHVSEESQVYRLSSAIQYETDPVSNEVVGNRYTKDGSVTETDISGLTDIDAPLDKILSRSDFEGTWPTANVASDRIAGSSLVRELKNVETNNPNDYYDEEKFGFVYFDEEATVKIRDLLPTATPDKSSLAFVSYDDERWETILDACNANNLVTLYNQAAYQTKAVEEIGLPATLHADGPSGFTCFLAKEQISGTNQYCSEPVIASTWNAELVEKFGEAIGEEGIWGYDVTGQPYSSIYAPGLNIHRSQFGGRCSEYFSEDAFLTGKIGAAEVRGMQNKGVVPMIKHFAVNEQETHRSINGDCSWLTEQSLREIYLKGFEIVVKEGNARGLMTSFNRIGSMWTGGDYRLCTEILRNEWGFIGMVICDFNTCPEHMNGRQMAYAGGDLNLQTTGGGIFDCDPSDMADAIILRQAAKNIMYSMVNSNAMNGEIISYSTPTWITGMIIADVVIFLGLAVWGFFTFVDLKKKKD